MRCHFFTGSVGLIKSLLGATLGYAACYWRVIFTTVVDIVSGVKGNHLERVVYASAPPAPGLEPPRQHAMPASIA